MSSFVPELPTNPRRRKKKVIRLPVRFFCPTHQKEEPAIIKVKEGNPSTELELWGTKVKIYKVPNMRGEEIPVIETVESKDKTIETVLFWKAVEMINQEYKVPPLIAINTKHDTIEVFKLVQKIFKVL